MTKEEVQKLEQILWKREYEEWINSNSQNIDLDKKSFKKGYEAAVWVLVEFWERGTHQRQLF